MNTIVTERDRILEILKVFKANYAKTYLLFLYFKKEKAFSRDLNALTYSIKLSLFVIMLQIYRIFL